MSAIIFSFLLALGRGALLVFMFFRPSKVLFCNNGCDGEATGSLSSSSMMMFNDVVGSL